MGFDTFGEDIQRAALDPDHWPDLLHRISREAGALGAILISEAHRIPVPPISRDLVPLMGRYYGEGWNARDVRFRGIDLALRNGAVTDHEILSAEEMRGSPYYQELLRPEGCKWFCSLSFGVAGRPWFLTIQRTIRQGAFEPDEVARLITLRDALGAAGNLSHALSFAQVSGMADAFDHLAKPALILDERGMLIRCNAAAQRVLDTLATLRHREIRFHDGANQRNFDSALAQAGLSAPLGGRPRTPSVLKDAAGRTLGIGATALGDWARYSFTQANYLVFLGEARDDSAPAARWGARYRLTPAEIRVARSLTAGLSVREIADLHGIAYETARTQLKSILSKTGARRQTELVTLLSNAMGDGT